MLFRSFADLPAYLLTTIPPSNYEVLLDYYCLKAYHGATRQNRTRFWNLRNQKELSHSDKNYNSVLNLCQLYGFASECYNYAYSSNWKEGLI